MIKHFVKRELMIAFSIINKQSTSLTELSTELEIPKRTIKEDMIKLNKLFEELFGKDDFIVSSKQGTISINEAYRHDSIQYFYELKLALLKNSTMFNYCVLLATNSSLTRDQLLDSLFISEVYLSKLTKKLNLFLKKFDILIHTVNQEYILLGDELSIRLFSYLFLQDAFQNLEWPFKNATIQELQATVPEEILKNSHKRSETQKAALYIQYEILRTRILNNRFLSQTCTEQVKDLLILIKENQDVGLIFHENSFGDIPEDRLTEEILYFNFFARIFIPGIIQNHNRAQLGKKFSATNHPICQLSNAILDHFLAASELSLSLEKRYMYTYYITLFNILYFLVDKKFETFLGLFIPKPVYHTQLELPSINKIRSDIGALIDDENQASYLSSLLYSLSYSEITPQLTIYLQITKNFTAFYSINNRLAALYNEKNISITENYSEADIILTDMLEQGEDSKTVFYLDAVNNEEGWKNLLILIQEKYLEKIKLESY